MGCSRLRRIVQASALLFFAATIIAASTGVASDERIKVGRVTDIEKNLDELTAFANQPQVGHVYRRTLNVGTSILPEESEEQINKFTQINTPSNSPRVVKISVAGPGEKVKNNAIAIFCEPVDYATAFMPAPSCKESLSTAIENLRSMYEDDPENATKFLLQTYNLTDLKRDTQKITEAGSTMAETVKNGNGEKLKEYWKKRLEIYKQSLEMGAKIGQIAIDIRTDDSSPLPISVG
jgi:hypothetical protein